MPRDAPDAFELRRQLKGHPGHLGFELKCNKPLFWTVPKRLVAANLQTDLYPATRRVHIDGRFWLKNRHARALDTVILLVPAPARVRQLVLARPAATLVLNDTTLGQAQFRLYRLAQPLAPATRSNMSAVLDYSETGFPNSGSNTNIVQKDNSQGVKL